MIHRSLCQALFLGLLVLCPGRRVSAQWEVFDMATAGFLSNTVRALTVTLDGDVWAGTEFGLAHYDGASWEIFRADDSGLPDNDVRALAPGIHGGVWIGTLSGLAFLQGGTWTVYNTSNSDLPENYIRCLKPAPDGSIWVGTAGGLAWFDGTDQWHVYTSGEDSYNGLQLPGINIASLALRDDGLLCIGTVNAGFTYLTDSSITVYTTFDNGLPDNTALGVAVDASGNRWVACPAGALLSHAGPFVGGAWVMYNIINSNIPSNALNCILIDAAGRRIVGTQNAGVGIFSGASSWANYRMANSGIPGDEVLCMALDQAGALWVGTSAGGAARFDYTMGVEERTASNALQVYPSPCVDRLGWTLDANTQGADYRLMDACGRVIRAGRLTGTTGLLDVGSLASGSYILTIIDRAKGGVRTARFLKA
ncbi:MAG: two-component regulator propeller domain-containing protein [Flavobacteriales bacterium]